MIFVILSVAAGAVLALRHCTVFALVPVVIILAAGAMATGIATGHDPRTIAVEVLGAVLSTQFGYSAAIVAAAYVRAASSSKLLQSIQAAIGQELGTAIETPRDLPPEMAVLLKKLQDASGLKRVRSSQPCIIAARRWVGAKSKEKPRKNTRGAWTGTAVVGGILIPVPIQQRPTRASVPWNSSVCGHWRPSDWSFVSMQ